jgi:maltose O-acetyltransferase
MGNKITHKLWFAAVNSVSASRLLTANARAAALRAFGMDIGDAAIDAGVTFQSRNVRISDGCYINQNVFFDDGPEISLGRNVSIGMGSYSLTGSHHVGGPDRRAEGITKAPVTIGAGSWLGARVTVMPGVTIGEGCIIAAGSVVTADTKPHTMCAGVPAVAQKDLSEVTA